MVAAGDRRRGDDQEPRQVQGHHRAADRSAQDCTEAQAKQLIATGKPIYYATGSMHSPETGSPEMLMELAYRLAVEETPFIQKIRNNVIVVITPAIEVDGREKAGGQLARAQAVRTRRAAAGLLGQVRPARQQSRRHRQSACKLTQNVLQAYLDWHPTVLARPARVGDAALHLHRHRPVQPVVDPIQVNEWWLLAQNEIMEMTKRGVPGVWTYGYYDGWVPNYMFWIGVTPQLDRPVLRDPELRRRRELPAGRVTQSREWYGPNPDAARHDVGAAQQRQHAAERAAAGDELRREEQGDVPRELLPEEQAHRSNAARPRRPMPT